MLWTQDDAPEKGSGITKVDLVDGVSRDVGWGGRDVYPQIYDEALFTH